MAVAGLLFIKNPNDWLDKVLQRIPLKFNKLSLNRTHTYLGKVKLVGEIAQETKIVQTLPHQLSYMKLNVPFKLWTEV